MLRPWSEEEIQLVREMYAEFSAPYIAKQLQGRTAKSVYALASKYGLPKRGKVKVPRASPDRSDRWSDDVLANYEPKLVDGLRRCEACGHPTMPDGARAKLTRIQRRMFDIIHRSGAAGISSPDLMALIYQERADGGPDSPNILAVQTAYMRVKLKPFGITISSTRGPGAVWKIEATGSELKCS